ncbi:DUF721 domain-containing protein [Candidatus Peregrinibacteria bacterium]|nr:DUF721 domain-containing protein [Candidatus Peregrinibacteria bacterium]
MFQPFQKYLEEAAKSYGIKTEMKAAEICEQCRKLIPKIFSDIETPEKYLRPAYFRNGDLTIKVESQAFAQEVVMRKKQLIDELNTRAGMKVIRNLKTILADTPQYSPESQDQSDW